MSCGCLSLDMGASSTLSFDGKWTLISTTTTTSNFGISGSALSLLSSYLHNCSHSVSVNSHLSSSASISTGVPQGSVLSPLLFCLYTTPLTYHLSDSAASFDLYGDD